mmetsp:Transcript_10817/g.20419  ORF Transcript_10817/g.20419 Transcript_10817/m.20419 type:complete len:261 (+) Transcript_10817:71-853(+)
MFSMSSGGGKKEEEEVDMSPFESQAFLVRTKGAGNLNTWPDVLTVRRVGVTSEEKPTTTSGSEFYLRKEGNNCCYVSTEVWSVSEKTVFSLLDQNDVWLVCELAPVYKDKKKTWTLECKIKEGKTKETPPRWAMDVEVSVVGKFQGCPCFLSKTAHTTRRINRNKPMNNKLLAIEEDASLTEASLVNPGMFTERFEETYKALGGTGSLSEGEDGDLTWFNAGLRIGVGVGLGVCLGAGLGAGILVRSYQYTANSLKKRLF